MGRCHSCNAVVTKDDVKCYVCGEAIPGRGGFSLFAWLWKPANKRARNRAEEAKARIQHGQVDSTRI